MDRCALQFRDFLGLLVIFWVFRCFSGVFGAFLGLSVLSGSFGAFLGLSVLFRPGRRVSGGFGGFPAARRGSPRILAIKNAARAVQGPVPISWVPTP